MVGHTLKRSLVALGEAQRQQSLREFRRQCLQRSQETKDRRRTPEQWRELQRRSPGPPRDVAEITLENKALLDPGKLCLPCTQAGCGSWGTDTILGMTPCAGLISSATSTSYPNTPHRPEMTMSSLATYGRCCEARLGAQTSACLKRMSVLTPRGTATSRRPTSAP